jgi:hypothetical protein
MEKFKPGLQKGITTIFEGVRIPKEARPQQSPGAPPIKTFGGGAGDPGPKPLSPDKQVLPIRRFLPRSWAAPAAAAPKRSKVISILKTFKEIPLRIFRPRATWSAKRRSDIAKHLLS